MDNEDWKQHFKTRKLKGIGNDREMSTAYHEAGHAFVNLYYGLISRKVTIIPDKERESLGHHEPVWLLEYSYDPSDYFFENNIDLPNDAIIEYLTMSLMAGIISGAFYTGEYNWGGSFSDLDRILDVHVSYGIFDIPSLQPSWDKTFNLIEKNLEFVQQIANDLYKEKTLDSKYFEKMIFKIEVNPILEKYRF